MTSPTTDPAITRINELLALGSRVATDLGEIMANVADVLAKIAELQSGQTELMKDVRRLIAAGDTTAAVAALDGLIASNEALDAEVEAASPEPATEPAPEAPAEG